MMLGNGKAIGSKFGITFVGKWVWGMKDYIDLSFMHLFDPRQLYEDYENLGTKKPLEHDTLFDDDQDQQASIKSKVATACKQ